MESGEISAAEETLFNRARTVHDEGRYAEAEEFYRAALSLSPDRIQVQHNLATLLQATGRLQEARDRLEAIVARDADQAGSRYALAIVLLDLGDYERGWPLYEARRLLPDLKIPQPILPFPEWSGQPLAGKRIVLFPEQGLGDTIQFSRLALSLRDQGAAVVLLSPPPLARLLTQGLEGVEVQSAAGTVELGEPDYWALLGSLPARLGLRLETVPASPYLRGAAQAPSSRPSGWRIGLMTRGNPRYANDARRSLSQAQAARLCARLAALPGVDVVSLHPEDSGAADFRDTAQIIAGLDLVVSVDTAVAHLAGAMGKRTMVLVPGVSLDWRWLRGLGGDASPWYRSHRLFRSGPDGDWSAALSQLQDALAILTKQPPAPT
jgi:tetratricopeptide (TPR) repeat protein